MFLSVYLPDNAANLYLLCFISLMIFFTFALKGTQIQGSFILALSGRSKDRQNHFEKLLHTFSWCILLKRHVFWWSKCLMQGELSKISFGWLVTNIVKESIKWNKYTNTSINGVMDPLLICCIHGLPIQIECLTCRLWQARRQMEIRILNFNLFILFRTA